MRTKGQRFPTYENLVQTKYSGFTVDCTGDTVNQSQRRVTSPTSKMFRQHLKCSLTAPRSAGTSFGFFVSFYSASCLSLGDSTALSGPASRLASAMTFSGCDTSPTVDCSVLFQSVERRVHRNLEGLANVRLDELPGCLAATLTFFLCLRGGEDSERGKTKLFAGVKVTALTTMHAEERQHECSQRHAEVRAERTEQPFQAQSVSHRTD